MHLPPAWQALPGPWDLASPLAGLWWVMFAGVQPQGGLGHSAELTCRCTSATPLASITHDFVFIVSQLSGNSIQGSIFPIISSAWRHLDCSKPPRLMR